MLLNELMDHIKNDGLKIKLKRQFNNKVSPEEILKYLNDWQGYSQVIRVIASIITLGIIPLVYFIWAKHHHKPHTNWATKPKFDTHDAMLIIKGKVELNDSSSEELEENSQKLTVQKIVILPHDTEQARATLVTLHPRKEKTHSDKDSEEESSEVFETEERSHATILANGKIFIREKYKNKNGIIKHQFSIYNDANQLEKKCFTQSEDENQGTPISPAIVYPGTSVFIFSTNENNLFIQDAEGNHFITIKYTNIPDNAVIFPVCLYIKENNFFVYVAAENEGVITLHKFSNLRAYNSYSQLFDNSSENFTALTYNPAHSIIYAIDSTHRIYSIKTNSYKPKAPVLEGELSDLPESTQITKLAVSYDGHYLYAADKDGNIYYYETSDFEKFTLLNTATMDDGKILDLKCVEDPKFIDIAKKKLLIVSTQGIYSEAIPDFSENAQDKSEDQSETQSSDDKPKTKKPRKTEELTTAQNLAKQRQKLHKTHDKFEGENDTDEFTQSQGPE